MSAGFTVVAARAAVVQDLGRRRARDGIATGGALDQHAARVAQLLVGNPVGAPLAELLLGELTIRLDHDGLVAATGAPAALEVGGAQAPGWQPVPVAAGVEVRLSRIHDGARACLAVAGRWRVPTFAGGAGPDDGLGFRTPLEAGVRIALRDRPRAPSNPWLRVPVLRSSAHPPPAADRFTLDVTPGPDLGLSPGLQRALEAGAFTVDPMSDAVGVRLSGALPSIRPPGHLLSRGVPIGAVELPGGPDELIVLQRARSLTAGYPIVAVVSRVAQDRVGQLLPGDAVRLRFRSARDCVLDARAQAAEEALIGERLRTAIAASR